MASSQILKRFVERSGRMSKVFNVFLLFVYKQLLRAMVHSQLKKAWCRPVGCLAANCKQCMFLARRSKRKLKHLDPY
jgi:hypothetical protein